MQVGVCKNKLHPFFCKSINEHRPTTSMASKTLLLAAVAVFSLSLPTAVSSLECSYVFPEFQNPQTCLEYDLTTLSTYGPYNITPNGPTGFRYLIKVLYIISMSVYM